MLQYLERNNEPLSKVRFRSFQLQPNDDNSKPNYLMNRFRASGLGTVDEFREYFYNAVGRDAESLGLHYDIDSVVSKNSIRAHMGLQYATLFGKQGDYFRRAMSAHFEKGEDYYDFAVIDRILHELELDIEDFHERENETRSLVADDMNLAMERGVRSVPAFFQDGIVLQNTGSFQLFDVFMK